jgi:hypothetical protein
MEPKDALSLFMSIQALLLAAATVGVTVWRTRQPAEDVGYAQMLATGCFVLVLVLSIGGLAAWLDIFARCKTAPKDVLDGIQAGVILVALGVLPWVARQISKAAHR